MMTQLRTVDMQDLNMALLTESCSDLRWSCLAGRVGDGM